MLPLDTLRTFRPFIATPSYGFNTTAPYSQSLFLLGNLAGKLGMDLGLEYRGESLIPRSRNELTRLFMLGDYTHLFFWDADVKASPESFIRLLLSNKDVAVGVYPLKKLEPSYPFFPRKPGETDADGFAEVYPATSGFMCISREVIKIMMKAYPERNYLPDTGPDDGLHFDLFPAFIEPESRRYWSEDYGFCYLWHKIGGKVYADIHSKLSHYGQHLYHGDLMEHLQYGKEAHLDKEAA